MAPVQNGVVRDVAQMIYVAGCTPSCFMSTVQVNRLFSEYLLSSSARVATMTNQRMAENKDKGLTGYGSVNVFVTDWGGILTLEANRLQQVDDTARSTGYVLTPEYLRQSFITGYNAERLAKTGLSEKWLISVDYSLLVTNDLSQGAIRDIDETLPVLDVPA